MRDPMKVLVVGGGPAGMSAALHACELGAQVTLLEADQVGGTSLNRGPAPVRTLARAARLARDWGSWTRFGLEGAPPVPNLAALQGNAARVARYAHERKHLAEHLRASGIDLVEGTGVVRFADDHTIQADDGHVWTADRVIIAVGGRAAALPVPGGELASTYDDLLTLKALPEHAVIIGGADTGCQIASILGDFGIRVTVFEATPALLASADPDVSAGMRSAFEARGLTIHTGTLVERLEKHASRITVTYRGPNGSDRVIGDAVFAAIGWPANIETLGLERAGVAAGRGGLVVDEYLRTNVEHIFAAGDVTGHYKLVQTARSEGRIAGRNAVLGPVQRADYEIIPTGSFTDPEYGQVGLTEPAAALNGEVVSAVARYDDLVRPVVDGRPDGFCKLLVDRSHRSVVGAHVLGEYSAEIVQVAAAMMAAGMTIEQIAGLSYAFPTVTEAIGMAAQNICRQLDLGGFPQVWSELDVSQEKTARLP
ncbi:dihydrolipoyl dehydrogenase family protein [Actinospica robiniae]|uniref:dihydrolipoyl dehydrogenase family protein n=1 Tax=Actinospica robiniae TaxID=304901 RepID=UPI0009FF2BC3|nr:NAD(P)/FAD-dependent oxidoreductase [Actinospica robiniae]